MTLLLQWRVAEAELELRWRASGNVLEALAQDPMQALAGFLVPPAIAAAVEPLIHQQTTASSVWTIAHNLGHLPDVIIFDETGEQVLADVRNDDLNQVSIIFSTPITGSARID